MSRFLDPFGRTIFERRTPDGLYLENAPGQYVCDFCTAPDPTWLYPCGPMAIVGHPNIEGSDDEWAACDRCRELIDAGAARALARRMVQVQARQPLAPEFGLRAPDEHFRLNLTNVRRFLAARTGPARPLRT